MKPKYVYHRSKKRLIGNILIPRKPQDLSGQNIKKGVYASEKKEIAIAMALVNEKHISASMNFEARPIKITVIRGTLRRKFFYLYTLPRKTFREKPKKSHQWVSSKSVKPLKIEKLKTKGYMYLIRKATLKEKKKFFSRIKK